MITPSVAVLISSIVPTRENHLNLLDENHYQFLVQEARRREKQQERAKGKLDKIKQQKETLILKAKLKKEEREILHSPEKLEDIKARVIQKNANKLTKAIKKAKQGWNEIQQAFIYGINAVGRMLTSGVNLSFAKAEDEEDKSEKNPKPKRKQKSC